MGQDAIRYLSRYHQSRSEVCMSPCARRVTPDTESPLQPGPTAAANESSIFARNLHDSEFFLIRGPAGEPSWGL